jgi:ABC-type branched-subunit amino acid transport system permease subunit
MSVEALLTALLVLVATLVACQLYRTGREVGYDNGVRDGQDRCRALGHRDHDRLPIS